MISKKLRVLSQVAVTLSLFALVACNNEKKEETKPMESAPTMQEAPAETAPAQQTGGTEGGAAAEHQE